MNEGRDGDGLGVGLWGRLRYGGMYGVCVREFSGDECRRLCPLTITDTTSVNSFIWSGGLDMKVPMKKPLGYLPTNLLMLLTLSPISIPNILPNLALSPFNKSVRPFFIPFCCFSVFPFHCISVYYPFRLIPPYYSFPLSYIPSIVHTKKIKSRKRKRKSIQNNSMFKKFMIHYIF